MASIREQIVAAMVTALNTGRPGGVPVIERSRRLSVSESAALSAITLDPVKCIPQAVGKPGAPLTQAELTVEVEMLMAGTATDRPDKLVDPLYSWIVTLVGTTLGGLCEIAEGESTFEFGGAGEYPTVLLRTELIATFSYRASDPTQKT